MANPFEDIRKSRETAAQQRLLKIEERMQLYRTYDAQIKTILGQLRDSIGGWVSCSFDDDRLSAMFIPSQKEETLNRSPLWQLRNSPHIEYADDEMDRSIGINFLYLHSPLRFHVFYETARSYNSHQTGMVYYRLLPLDSGIDTTGDSADELIATLRKLYESHSVDINRCFPGPDQA